MAFIEGATGQSPKSPTVVESMNSQLDMLTQDFRSYLLKLEGLEARLFGGSNEKGVGRAEGPSPVPNGVLEMGSVKLGELGRLSSGFREVISKLEKLA